MNIHNSQTAQGAQNTIRIAGEGSSAASGESLPSVAPVNRGTLSGKQETTLGQSMKVTALINNLQRDLESDPNVVFDPPFFPIAKYQRLDLIGKVRGIEEEVQRSSLDESLKSTISGNSLKDNATDTEISASIGKLFELRDQLTGSKSASPDEIKPGLILSIEV